MSATILEDSSFAYDLNGSDPDSGDTLTWTISQASANGSVSIDSSTGVLEYVPNTDFNGSDSFSVHLSDGLLHHSLSVQISITGINDAPFGISHPSDLNFTENLPFGSIISVLSALDPDPGDTHTFNLLNSEDSSLASVPFSLDANGTLRTASSFDFESNASTYTVQVQATDLAGSTVVSTLSLNLINVIEDMDGDSIEDAYDPDIDGDGYTNEQEIAYGSDPLDPLSMLNRAPSFSGSTSFSVVENNQTAVFLLSASDLDTDDILSFSISGPDAAKFSVNAATGGISFLQAPDFEANGSVAGDNLFLLSIQVSDGEDSASSSITIEVLDIYEPPPNDPPSDLLLSASILEENLPAGSLIGSFSTLDPDDLSGEDQYLYELVTETSSDQPTAFVVDENGSLYSGMAFDFESQSSHSIRVRTTDHFGESFEKSFSISVSDAFIPIVRTDTSTDLSSSGATLSATILDQGGTSGVFRSGILVSQAPEPMLGNFGSSDFPSTQMADGFSITANNLLSGTRYYFRAYAENSEGISYGSSQLFETVSLEASPHWASATPAPEAPNWWNSTWLGTYYSTDDSGWILHSELGWIFALPSPESGVWFWLQERGWMWTDSGLYPYLFDNPSSSWVYFYGGDQRRLLFYNYKLGSWIQVAKEQALSQ
jgi:VCBS repeat-containing protein